MAPALRALLQSGAGEQSDLDVIDPGPRHDLDRSGNHLRFHRQITADSADWPPAAHRRDSCAHHIRRERTQRAVRASFKSMMSAPCARTSAASSGPVTLAKSKVMGALR